MRASTYIASLWRPESRLGQCSANVYQPSPDTQLAGLQDKKGLTPLRMPRGIARQREDKREGLGKLLDNCASHLPRNLDTIVEIPAVIDAARLGPDLGKKRPDCGYGVDSDQPTRPSDGSETETVWMSRILLGFPQSAYHRDKAPSHPSNLNSGPEPQLAPTPASSHKLQDRPIA